MNRIDDLCDSIENDLGGIKEKTILATGGFVMGAEKTIIGDCDKKGEVIVPLSDLEKFVPQEPKDIKVEGIKVDDELLELILNHIHRSIKNTENHEVFLEKGHDILAPEEGSHWLRCVSNGTQTITFKFNGGAVINDRINVGRMCKWNY